MVSLYFYYCNIFIVHSIIQKYMHSIHVYMDNSVCTDINNINTFKVKHCFHLITAVRMNFSES